MSLTLVFDENLVFFTNELDRTDKLVFFAILGRQVELDSTSVSRTLADFYAHSTCSPTRAALMTGSSLPGPRSLSFRAG